MSDFIAEVIGKDSHEDGMLVVVRMTGFGAEDGPMMSRAKGRAIASTRFGRDQASTTEVSNVETEFGSRTEERDLFADKSEALFSGPASGVRDRLKAFRKNGLFAEVKKTKKLKTDRVVSEEKLEDTFGPLSSAVNTYEYEVLVTTNYSFT